MLCFCVTEPDHGMEPGLAHHFFLQLMSGMVSDSNGIVLGQRNLCFTLYSKLLTVP